MNIVVCSNKALKDIFNLKIISGLFIIGVFLFISFSLLIYFSWEWILKLASLIALWIPINLLKIVGAFFIVFFLWFFAVLVTFSIITVILGPFILKKFEHKGYYLYSVFLVLILATIFAFLIFDNWSLLNKNIENFLVLLPFNTVVEGVGVIISLYFLYNFFILSMFSIVFLFLRFFTKKIKSAEYINLIDSKGTSQRENIHIVKSVITNLFLFILLFPLLFVPIVNILIQIFIWAKLYYDAFLYLCNRNCLLEEIEKIKEHNFSIWLIAIFASLLNFLPVLNFYVPLFVVFTFFHCIMIHKLELRKT